MQINITTDDNVNFNEIAEFVKWALTNPAFLNDGEFEPRLIESENLCGKITKYRKSIRIIIMKKCRS